MKIFDMWNVKFVKHRKFERKNRMRTCFQLKLLVVCGCLLITLLATSMLGESNVGMNFAIASENAVTIIEKCKQNLAATDCIEYNVKTDDTYYSPDTQNKEPAYKVFKSVVCRNGDLIDIRGTRDLYKDNKILESAPDYRIVGEGYAIWDNDPHNTRAIHVSAIATVKNRSNLAIPLLCGGNYGLYMDGYVGDGIRFVDLMLLEPDKMEILGETTIGKFPCTQIKSTTKYGIMTAFIDVKNGYVARKVSCFQDRNSVTLSGNKRLEFFDEGLSFEVTVENLEFKKIGDNYVPIKGQITIVRKDIGDKTYRTVCQSTRDNVVLSPDFSKKNVFNADYLKENEVNNTDDSESGVVYKWDGKKPIPYIQNVDIKNAVIPQKIINVIRFLLILAGTVILLSVIVFTIYQKIITRKSR